jgi:hypothetical protein
MNVVLFRAATLAAKEDHALAAVAAATPEQALAVTIVRPRLVLVAFDHKT